MVEKKSWWWRGDGGEEDLVEERSWSVGKKSW